MLHLAALEHRYNNVAQTRISANHEAHETHNHDEGVADHQPHLLLSLVLVPVHADLDPGGEGETEGWQAQRAEERNEQLQVGNGDGQED